MPGTVDVKKNNLSLEYKISLWVKCVVLFTITLFIPSVYKIYFKVKETECQMTYMFQYPEYIVSIFLYIQ